ncbi:hypothetical protein EDB83DRAFT_2323232 [Lactarius deliciosus]|nr:hypothetical protein EDB83DRAFT_2323232 [Lactarius deliciosus]
MDFSKSIYWCRVPAVRTRSLTPASLRLVHDTLTITLSLSHPHSDVHILPVVRGSPTGLRSVPPRPHTLRVTPPLALGLHRPSFRVPPSRACGVGWGAAGRGGVRGAGQASPAPKGTGVGTLSSVRRQGGAGVTCPHAHPFRTNGADVGKGGAAGPRERGGPDTGEGPARPLSACEGVAAVNAGDRVGERLTMARDAGEGEEHRPVLLRPRMGDPILTEMGSEATSEGSSHPHYIIHYIPPSCANSGTSTPPLLPPPSSTSSPSPASRAAIRSVRALPPCLGHHIRAGLLPPGPSLPNICPIRAERPLPAGARRTACPPQSPLVQATPAQPHAPRPAHICKRRDGAPTPPHGPRQPNPTCPALPAYARGWMVRPAPSRPRTQGEGRRAQLSPPQRGRHQPNPTHCAPPRPAPPAFTRGGTVRPPLRAGHISPTPRAPPCPRMQEDGRCVQPRPAHARKGRDGAHSSALLSAGDTSPTPRTVPRPAPPAFMRGGTARPPLHAGHASPAPRCPCTQGGGSARPSPPHGLCQPGVYAPRHAGAPPGMQEGRCTQPSPLRAGCATPGLHAVPEKRCMQGGGPHTCTRRGYME